VADYIFVNIVGGKITDKKKRTHAHYLTLSRDFGKYCSNPSSFTAVKKDEVLKLIKDIVDDGG
jgi:hypothetical protein